MLYKKRGFLAPNTAYGNPLFLKFLWKENKVGSKVMLAVASANKSADAATNNFNPA